MLRCYFCIPKMFSQTTKPRNIRTVLKPVGLVSSFPKTGTENMSAATISPPEEQYIYVSYCLLLFCFFFLPVAHLLFKAVKRCYRPISWISLYMWKRDSRRWCQKSLKKWAFIREVIVLCRHVCCIVCVVFSNGQSSSCPFCPFCPFPATLHSLQLNQIFGFFSAMLEICVHRTKTSMKPQDRYLKLI